MKQLDDSVGALLKHLDDIGEADNTIVVFTTDNGAEVFTWPDGGMTPFKGTKGTAYEGGFRAPCIARWPGKIKPGTVQNGIFSGLDWFPTLVRRRRQPEHHRPAAQGRQARRSDLQEPPRRLQPAGPAAGQGAVQAPRVLLLRRAPARRRAARRLQVPVPAAAARLARRRRSRPTCPAWSTFARIRSSGRPPSTRESLNNLGGGYMNDFFAREFWRFVLVQQKVADLAKTAIDYPADAGSGFLQPGGGEEADRRGDQEQARAVGNGRRGGVCLCRVIPLRSAAPPRGCAGGRGALSGTGPARCRAACGRH